MCMFCESAFGVYVWLRLAAVRCTTPRHMRLECACPRAPPASAPALARTGRSRSCPVADPQPRRARSVHAPSLRLAARARTRRRTSCLSLRRWPGSWGGPRAPPCVHARVCCGLPLALVLVRPTHTGALCVPRSSSNAGRAQRSCSGQAWWCAWGRGRCANRVGNDAGREMPLRCAAAAVATATALWRWVLRCRAGLASRLPSSACSCSFRRFCLPPRS